MMSGISFLKQSADRLIRLGLKATSSIKRELISRAKLLALEKTHGTKP